MNKEIAKLQYISQENEAADHLAQIERFCEGGGKWVQLRMKAVSAELFMETAQAARKICDRYQAKLIINDNVQIARTVKADGVHLGSEDMHPTLARELLGEKAIIGGTANTFYDIEQLAKAKVDYVGLGPYRFTPTKKNLSPVIGPEGLEVIMAYCKEYRIDIPIVAVGGIRESDLDTVLSCGAYGIAVSGMLSGMGDKTEQIQRIHNILEDAKVKNS